MQLKRIIGSILLLIGLFFLNFKVGQADFDKILLFSGISFFGYALIVHNIIVDKNQELFDLGILYFGCLVLLVFNFPLLSDDIFRFLWDGHLLANDISILEFTPEQLMNNPAQNDRYLEEIYPKLNSPGYFTIYPPLSQLSFLAAVPGGTSVLKSTILLKGVLALSGILSFVFMPRLLQLLGMNPSTSFVYLLNPLVLTETIGQCHFEGMMVAFLIAAIYFLFRNRIIISAIFLACSIATKLLPLIFLPIILIYLRDKKRIIEYMISLILSSVLMWMMFFDYSMVPNYLASVDLYFQKFEFNASIYYLVRQLGYWASGYNLIASIGPLLGLITLGLVLSLAFGIRRVEEKQPKVVRVMFFSFVIYLFLATTVHPWYLTIPLMLCVLTRKWWFLLWSFLVIFSYAKYGSETSGQYHYWVALEYILVFVSMFYWYKVATKKPNLN